MYGRKYGDQFLTFEASGGLIHSALVMQDRETRSYWALMAGEAIAGKKLGTRLEQLPHGETKLFLYRSKKSNMRESTTAYFTTGAGFKFDNNVWIDLSSSCVFNTESRRFEGDSVNCPKRLVGFDTFWYTWSLTNPDTEVLK